MTQGLQEPHGEVTAWVHMIEVGPWTSQKCASEICRRKVSHAQLLLGRRVTMTGMRRTARISARVRTVKSIVLCYLISTAS